MLRIEERKGGLGHGGIVQFLPELVSGRGTARAASGGGAAANAAVPAAPLHPRLRRRSASPSKLGEELGSQPIFCPVLAQSAMKAAMPLSVSGCLTSWRITLGGAVITSAPILAASSTWIGLRTLATRISVSKA